MNKLTVLLLSMTGFLVTVSPVRADFIATASLSPATDGATNSKGSGTAWIDYNATTDVFNYKLSWTNLTGSATMAHIHLGAPGVSGPIIIPFFMSLMPATDSISGTLTQADVTPADGVSTIAGVAQAIEMGDAYVNIHTAEYPKGELRGQLTLVPEPASMGLLLVSLSVLGGVVGKKRRMAA